MMHIGGDIPVGTEDKRGSVDVLGSHGPCFTYSDDSFPRKDGRTDGRSPEEGSNISGNSAVAEDKLGAIEEA